MMPAMENSLVTNFLLQTILFDKHCSISASGELHVYHNVTDDASLSDTTRIKRWNDDCSQTFVSNLNTDTIDVILSSMPAVDIVDKDSISIMIQLLLFLKLLKKTCGTSKRTQKVNNCSKSTSNQKPWTTNVTRKSRCQTRTVTDGRTDGQSGDFMLPPLGSITMLENIITDVERNIIWLKLLTLKTTWQHLVNHIKSYSAKPI